MSWEWRSGWRGRWGRDRGIIKEFVEEVVRKEMRLSNVRIRLVIYKYL
jgi:hypothetical protein